MGGHGGLNILPQKSWNVYGTKQRARVRRDEENARLEAEANAAEARDEARDERWRALRESGSRPREERVHLFEAEERAAMRAEERTRRGEDAGTREDAGDAFGGRGVGRNAVKPWYARVRGEEVVEERSTSLPARARRRREEEEALREKTRRERVASADGGSSVGVSRGTDRREKKARKREKREKRRRDAKDDDGDEIYRLRRERLEREGKEAERERALLARDERVVDRYHRSARGRR